MQDQVNNSVLIVDDEEQIIKSLRRALKPLNLNISSALNGQDALELLKNDKISLIISDQRMPGMYGVEFLSKSREYSPNSVRILLTGYADIDATIDAINSGDIKYYLSKPWDDNNLLSRVKESLELYNLGLSNRKLSRALSLQNKKLKEFNDNLENKVNEQTEVIRNKHDELSSRFIETIKALTTIIGLRFKEIDSHSNRVALMVESLCQKLDLSSKEKQDIIIASYLHDIGKIVISDKLMKKSEQNYTNEERIDMQRHSILGQTCICYIGGFEEVGVIIRHHHENYEGNGYPDNLVEQRIPLGSRIIRVVDEFDRIAYENGYPNQNKLKESAAYLVQYSGSLFDPEIVKKFIEYDIMNYLSTRDYNETKVVKTCELTEGMKIAADIYSQGDMFLLPKGATLSRGMINRIVKIDALDPIPNGIRIFKDIKNTGGKSVKKLQNTPGR